MNRFSPFQMTRWSVGILALLVGAVFIVSLLLRLYKIDQIPYGYHVDEMCSSITVQCLSTDGVDAHNNRYPLFGQTNYGTPKPMTYMYPAVLWGKAFGFSVPSFRRLSVIGHFVGILGLFFLGRALVSSSFGLWAVFLACISPWEWTSSRVAFESLQAPTFFIWGLYFFFRKKSYPSWSAAGLLFALAMYAYPPMRLQVPLMVLSLAVYALVKIKPKASSVAIFCLFFLLPVVPLVQKTFSGELQQRFNDISIASPGYLKFIGKTNSLHDLWALFVSNYKLHLSPSFLFSRGDPSLIHSSGHFGILSWLDMFCLASALVWLVLLIFKPLRDRCPWVEHRALLILCVVNIAIGIIPAALTNSELPNSLRIVGSWPFMCLFGAVMLDSWHKHCWPLSVIAFILGVSFFVSFSKVYFSVYREESKGMFDFWSKQQADQARSEEDWLKFKIMHYDRDYHFRYYLMQYQQDTCRDTQKKWFEQRKVLDALHIYPH